jgi:hypothetical protein
MLTIWRFTVSGEAFGRMSSATAAMFAIGYAVRAAGLTLALFSIYDACRRYCFPACVACREVFATLASER